MLLACKIKIIGNLFRYKWFDLIKFWLNSFDRWLNVALYRGFGSPTNFSMLFAAQQEHHGEYYCLTFPEHSHYWYWSLACEVTRNCRAV